MPEVWIPPQMQRSTGAPDRVQVDGATVRQVINNLERRHPGIKALLYDAELDDITPGLAVIVDGDVSQLGLMERVNADSEMHFLPAIGGGADAGPTPDAAGADPDVDQKTAPRTLADFLEGYIGVINSSELGLEGRSMSVDTGKQSADRETHFLPSTDPTPDTSGDEPDHRKTEPDGSGAAPAQPPSNLYESLKDFIGVINSDEFGPEGRTMSVDTGKRFADDLWEKYQRDQEEARQRYAKHRAQQQRELEQE